MEVKQTLADERDADSAYQHLQTELRRVRSGASEQTCKPTRFCDFSVSLLARKRAKGEIASAKTVQTWDTTLRLHLLPSWPKGFGDLFVDQIRRADIEAWIERIAPQVKTDDVSPVSANNWLRVLRVIMNAATDEFDLDRNPMKGVTFFDTSAHHTYTEEEPNALTPAEVPTFLRQAKLLYPQHFAMIALGLATGLRPSTLRPLRRQGPSQDVLWDESVLLVRRSHAYADNVMDTTKTKTRQRITLPTDLMDILRWHVERLEGPMKQSDLLFPSENGGFRTTSALVKPFLALEKAAGLKKHVTPKGMRRTFQDFARAAEVADIVTRAVSGHATEEMQRHYSTVNQGEIQAGLARVVSLGDFRKALEAKPETQSGVPSGVPTVEHVSVATNHGEPRGAA